MFNLQKKLEVTSDCLLANVHMLPVNSEEAKVPTFAAVVPVGEKKG